MLMFYLSLMETPEEEQWMIDIYEKYRSFCVNVARSITHNTEDAEDAAHTAFMDIIAKKEKYFKMECSVFRATLVVIVKNKAIDILRKNKRIDDVPVDEHIDLSSKEDDILDQLIQQEGYERFVEAVHRMNSQYQEILFLRYYLDMSNQEMSVKLGIKLKNVETRLYRAKVALKKELLKGGVPFGNEGKD